MRVDRRAQALARTAEALAQGAGIELPDGLALWALGGGRPAGVPAVPSEDPPTELVRAMEVALTDDERRRGAHYTPADLADAVVARALPHPASWVLNTTQTGAEDPRTRVDDLLTVVDPACGAGAMLLAAGRRLVALGCSPEVVARDRLWGADLDPVAAAVAEAVLALWSGGIAPGRGHLVGADALVAGRAVWASPPPLGFRAVVANPPFQGQLSSSTARGPAARAAVLARFGDAAAPSVDTAALFLLVGVELAAPGGRVAFVLPQSTAAARDAGPVRSAVARHARLVELWVPPGRPFGDRVHVCVPVLEVGDGQPEPDWAARLAEARGVPRVELPGVGPTIASLADAVAGFRQHYYGLVPHVSEGTAGQPLVTSGSIGVGTCGWGTAPVRFAKQSWSRPVVDVAAVRAGEPGLAGWLERVLRPKVVVATQTRVVEAAADLDGTWVPCTPVISVVPHDPAAVDRVVAALCAPPVAAWLARRASGTGLSPGAIRLSARLVQSVPLPPDERRWQLAADALAAGDLAAFATAATEMHRLAPDVAARVLTWWHDTRP
jgi:hypothetical protein